MTTIFQGDNCTLPLHTHLPPRTGVDRSRAATVHYPLVPSSSHLGKCKRHRHRNGTSNPL